MCRNHVASLTCSSGSQHRIWNKTCDSNAKKRQRVQKRQVPHHAPSAVSYYCAIPRRHLFQANQGAAVRSGQETCSSPFHQRPQGSNPTDHAQRRHAPRQFLEKSHLMRALRTQHRSSGCVRGRPNLHAESEACRARTQLPPTLDRSDMPPSRGYHHETARRAPDQSRQMSLFLLISCLRSSKLWRTLCPMRWQVQVLQCAQGNRI